jgi:hypothetical protein
MSNTKLTLNEPDLNIFNNAEEMDVHMSSKKQKIKLQIERAKKLPKEGSTVSEVAEALEMTDDEIEANLSVGVIVTKFTKGKRLVTNESLLWAVRNQKLKAYEVEKD